MNLEKTSPLHEFKNACIKSDDDLKAYIRYLSIDKERLYKKYGIIELKEFDNTHERISFYIENDIKLNEELTNLMDPIEAIKIDSVKYFERCKLNKKLCLESLQFNYFYIACTHGSRCILEYLLYNKENYLQCVALDIIIKNKHNHLIDLFPNIKRQNIYINIVKHGDLETIKCLYKSGVNFHKRDLQEAIKLNKKNIALLIHRNINCVLTQEENSYLYG